MSSTRRKDPEDESFSQGRYASSSAFEPGLLANLVARRCKAIKSPEDRALVWWLQAVSHREGGLEKFAEEFLAAFPERIGTKAMRRIGKQPGETYSAAEATEVDEEFGQRDLSRLLSYSFPSRVRVSRYVQDPFGESGENIFAGYEYEDQEPDAEDDPAIERSVAYYHDQAQPPVAKVVDLLRSACLDPLADVSAGSATRVSLPLFDDVLSALKAYRALEIATAENAIAETTISKRVFDDLDYAAHCRGLVVIEGDQRTGKSTATKNWCDRHPGGAVYVKLGVGNDDASFFRSIARALGTASSLTRKPTEMQMKIEDALQEGHLLLVLDEAHFLFAQTQRPRSAPSRLDWIRTALVDFNVGVALVSTPQFDRSCEMYERQLRWNAAQIRGRVKLKTLLPTELPADDLAAVARKMAPQADDISLTRLVGFAQSSDDYLAGIERLVCRATFFANRDGRESAGRADIKRALDEATPVLETPAPAPKAAPRKSRGVRAVVPRGHRETIPTAVQPRCKGTANTFSPALARRAGLDLSPDESGETEASERLQFTEAAALD